MSAATALVARVASRDAGWVHEAVVCLGCGGAVDDGEVGVPAGADVCGCPPPTRSTQALSCPECGGSLRPDARACPFCHSTVATTRCGHCLRWNMSDALHCGGCARALSPSERDGGLTMTCPRCAALLRQRSYADTELDECDGCGGVFIESAMMDRIITSRSAPEGLRLALPQTKASAPSDASYLKCPVCQVVMNRNNFGRISGVVIDVCRGHGAWFDAGEIADVLRFVETGGLNNPRAHQLTFSVPDGVPKGSFVQGDRLESYDGVVGFFTEGLAILWDGSYP